MKNWVFFLGCIAAYGQQVTISDTLTNSVGGGAWTGRITIALNSPSSASPLYYSTTSLAGWQYVLCVGVTGSDCSATTAAGVITVPLYANSTITPTGTSYSARYAPTKGSPTTETWTVTASSTKLYQIRSTTVPTPTTTFQSSQLALAAGSMVYGSSAGVGTALAAGSNGQVLALSGGYPAWTTNIAGNAGTATALAANGTNCAAGTFPLGVDASGNSESCTALPTTISGTANQITASASTGAVTLSLPATITGLTSVSSTGFTGALTGNASTATALASTVASGRLWIGQGTGVPTSDAGVTWDSALGRLATANIKDPTTNNSINLGLWPNGTATQSILTLYNNSAGGSAQYAQFTIVGPGSSSETRILTGANTGTAGDIVMSPGGTERMRWFRASGNVATGTATDLGYGLHAANKGTNGNLLVFDPTATTGTTKAVFAAGQGQSGNLLETRLYNATPGSGLLRTYIDSSGYLFSPYFAVTTYFVAQANDAAVTLRNSGQVTWVSNADATSGTRDTSLSRASAGVLQVGDGGANANGYLSAARIGVGTASPGAALEVSGLIRATGTSTPSAGAGMELSYDTGIGYLLTIDRATATFKPTGIDGTYVFFRRAGNEVGRFAAGTGNLLLGTTTDSNYKLEVANSGSSGTFRVYDQTATTGNTKEVIRAGAGQTTNLTEWQNNAGTVLTYLASGGNISTDATANFGTDVYFKNGGATQPNKIVASGPNSWLRLGQSVVIAWDNNTNALGGSMDSGLKRAAAGYVAVTDGSTGLGKIVVSQSTPAASTDACTAGALWADASYVYACTSSGVIKRATLASF